MWFIKDTLWNAPIHWIVEKNHLNILYDSCWCALKIILKTLRHIGLQEELFNILSIPDCGILKTNAVTLPAYRTASHEKLKVPYKSNSWTIPNNKKQMLANLSARAFITILIYPNSTIRKYFNAKNVSNKNPQKVRNVLGYVKTLVIT